MMGEKVFQLLPPHIPLLRLCKFYSYFNDSFFFYFFFFFRFQVVSFLELIVDVVGSLVSLVDQLKRLIRTCRGIWNIWTAQPSANANDGHNDVIVNQESTIWFYEEITYYICQRFVIYYCEFYNILCWLDIIKHP